MKLRGLKVAFVLAVVALAGCGGLNATEVQAEDIGIGACQDPRITMAITSIEGSQGWNATVQITNQGDGQVELLNPYLYLKAEALEDSMISFSADGWSSGPIVPPSGSLAVEFHERGQPVGEIGAWTQFEIMYYYDTELYRFFCSLTGDELPDSLYRSRP